MSIFNEYLEENVVVTNYDPVTGIEFQGIDTSSLTEICAELRESCLHMNGKMYVLEVMCNLGLVPVNEGVIKSTKDFFKSIIEKLKDFLSKIVDFFKNIFAKMEVMFTTNGKSFLDKYGGKISETLNSGNVEWIEFNERYVLDKSSHEDIYRKLDGALNTTITKFTNIKNKVVTMANEAKYAQSSRDKEGNVDDDKLKKNVNQSYDKSLQGKELESLMKSEEKDIANNIISSAESFDDVRSKLKDDTTEKDKDSTKTSDAAIIKKFLTYCNDHVSKDLIELKNTQTKFTTLINNTQNSIRDINNKFGMSDDAGNLSSIRQVCNWYVSTLTFFQEINAKRVSTRTQTFNYYISVLKRYTKKNYKVIAGTEAPKGAKASEYKNKKASEK